MKEEVIMCSTKEKRVCSGSVGVYGEFKDCRKCATKTDKG